MNKRSMPSMQMLIAGLDLLSLNLIYCTACYYFQDHFIRGLYFEYAFFMLYLNLSWLVVAAVINEYSEKSLNSFETFSKRSMKAFIYFVLLSNVYLFFSHQFFISRMFTAVVLISYALALIFNRFLYLFIQNFYKKNGGLLNKVVIIGYNNLSKKLVSYLERDFSNMSIVGFCEESENVHELSNYPILSNVSSALDICRQYGASEIYSTIAPGQNPDIYRLIDDAELNCIRFKVIPDLKYFIDRYGQIDFLNDIPVISLRREPLEDISNRMKKRVFDVIFSSAVVILLLSWLVPIIALLIKLSSRGPVFFTQDRLGKDNKVFKVYKFRTLRVSKNENEYKQVIKNDERVFRLGKLLRKMSLDELPQFFNALAGQMSVCGPRPHPLAINDTYKKIVDKYMVRQFLKPGITGWAQVNGFRGETENTLKMKRRIEYDLWYLENWSLWLDVKMIFLTVFNIIKGEANAF
ncbi:MAG TPA: undecaprenyl-phosphate glucose phosphotransferase [Puia sp.]|nr:undecaprenyl-phosphate glucose phosphotransferase [Puia sp.]